MIEINNLTSEKIDSKWVKLIILETLKLEKRENSKEVSVAIINADEIKEINSRYREIDSATDVLSFEGDDNILGEIIVCPEEVRNNGTNFKDEFKRVLIHGTLHILGYDHEKDQGEMIKKQEEYFSLINNN
ncbi:MAG: rRNA maturation RNase YbeY [Candidatus Pacebacteria bacterium]|nr:rRNA maturation RNase YbeY [Candidatus Paceibacterota bacterium]MDD3919194.1 rRNA maturation RNase YbeY [Candidatus Paceibacterota bacterium]